jgi:hypothetical protein
VQDIYPTHSLTPRTIIQRCSTFDVFYVYFKRRGPLALSSSSGAQWRRHRRSTLSLPSALEESNLEMKLKQHCTDLESTGQSLKLTPLLTDVQAKVFHCVRIYCQALFVQSVPIYLFHNSSEQPNQTVSSYLMTWEGTIILPTTLSTLRKNAPCVLCSVPSCVENGHDCRGSLRARLLLRRTGASAASRSGLETERSLGIWTTISNFNSWFFRGSTRGL